MALEELQKREEEEADMSPFSELMQWVRNYPYGLMGCRSNKELLGRVKAIDRHWNTVLGNVKETQAGVPKSSKGRKSKAVNKDHYSSKTFLGGDSVIMVPWNPLADGK